MSTASITLELPASGANAAEVSKHFGRVVAALKQHKALTGLKGIRMAVTHVPAVSTPGTKASLLTYAVELNATDPQATLARIVRRWPAGSMINAMENVFVASQIELELDFKDPNKAMLFKLSV